MMPLPLSPARLARRKQITAEMRRSSSGGWASRAAAWSRWDWFRWTLPWLSLGLALGALTDLAVRMSVHG